MISINLSMKRKTKILSAASNQVGLPAAVVEKDLWVTGILQMLFNTELKLLMKPHSFMTRCFALPDLYAGKMHALVYRTWQRHIKGRDWYDFEWYVRNNIPLDFKHLQARIKEFSGEDVSKGQFMELLRVKLGSADINNVKHDVLPYISQQQAKELDIWSNDYFLQLADMIKFEE